MATVGVVSGSLYRRTQPKSSALVLGRRPLGAILHSSNEPGELSQWLCHDDSTINIVVIIIIIIIDYDRRCGKMATLLCPRREGAISVAFVRPSVCLLRG